MPDPIPSIQPALGLEAIIPEIDPLGPEGELTQPDAGTGEGFVSELGRQIRNLDAIQRAADQQAADFAAGRADDPTAVILAAQRAQLSLQLASQIRNRLAESYHELFRMQI